MVWTSETCIWDLLSFFGTSAWKNVGGLQCPTFGFHVEPTTIPRLPHPNTRCNSRLPLPHWLHLQMVWVLGESPVCLLKNPWKPSKHHQHHVFLWNHQRLPRTLCLPKLGIIWSKQKNIESTPLYIQKWWLLMGTSLEPRKKPWLVGFYIGDEILPSDIGNIS